jgi:phage terminase small subunit
MTDDEDLNLTPKQEMFAQAYIETSNASEAYRRAYNAENTKPEVVWVKACELLKHGKVAVRVLQLREEHAARHAITVDSLTQMLKEDRELARKENEPTAAIKAVEVLAKLHGHMVEKKVVTSDNRHHHTAEPVSPFADFVAAAIGKRTEGETEGPLQN